MDKEATTKGPPVKTQIRLPSDLHEQIVKAAEESGRSLNAEMVQRLDQSFRRSVDDAEVGAFAERMKRTLDAQNEELELARFTVATTSQMLSAFLDPDLRTKGYPDAEHMEHVREAAAKVAEVYRSQLGSAANVIEKLPLSEETKRDLYGDADI